MGHRFMNFNRIKEGNYSALEFIKKFHNCSLCNVACFIIYSCCVFFFVDCDVFLPST